MARVTPNILIDNLSGALGDLVLVRRKGKLYARRKPSVVPRRTERQRARQEGFKLAAAYAQSVLADPEKRAPYEIAAKTRSATAQNLAIGDFLKPPKVEEIDASQYAGKAGQPIRIRAEDDFEVAAVQVVIRERGGALLEQGPAVRKENTNDWTYTAQKGVASGQIVSIEATATDRPAHKSTETILHEVGS